MWNWGNVKSRNWLLSARSLWGSCDSSGRIAGSDEGFCRPDYRDGGRASEAIVD